MAISSKRTASQRTLSGKQQHPSVASTEEYDDYLSYPHYSNTAPDLEYNDAPASTPYEEPLVQHHHTRVQHSPASNQRT